MTISLRDKFGDYGLISLLILHKVNDTDLFIDTWVMSCRVLKRNVEELTLEEEVGSVTGPGPIGPVVGSSEPIVEETIRSPTGFS